MQYKTAFFFVFFCIFGLVFFCACAKLTSSKGPCVNAPQGKETLRRRVYLAIPLRITIPCADDLVPKNIIPCANGF